MDRITLSDLHNHRHQPPTDAEVETVVLKLGLARVLDALDRLTAPMMQAAE